MPSRVAKPAKAAAAASSSSSTTPSALDQIVSIQKQLSSSSDLNPLSQLITIAKRQSRINSTTTDSAKERKEAAVAVLRAVQILTRSLRSLCSEDKVVLDHQVDQDGYLMSSGARGNAERSEAQKAVADWIRQRWNESVELLCALLGHEVEALRMESLQLLIDLQVSASSSLTRICAAADAAAAASASSSKSKKQGASDSTPVAAQPQGQWSTSPWRALTLALIAGSPTLAKLGSGQAGKSATVTREEGVYEDVRTKFAESGLEEYDDVRFATLREISVALRRPSPSAAQNPSLRANTLSLLLLLTAIPADAEDLNNFLIEELSIPPLGANSKRGKAKGKGKKKATGANGSDLSVHDDGDSEDGGNADNGADEDDDDMAGWFSDSDNEDARAGATTGEKRQSADKRSNSGLGSAARAAGSNKPKRKTFHQGLHILAVQKAAFSAAWLNLLLPRSATDETTGVSKLIGGELSLAATHEVLVRLHAQILPHLTRPALLHDFLVSCLDSRGATALLALNALFTLVTKHNLDYPQFYTRLYALLDASVLHMKYRARFLRLLETFLASTHLSAALVASFAKRLSRLSLRAPPAAIASVVPFIYNLLKRHPRCLCMVHKEWDGDRLNIGPAGVNDPFDPQETEPLRTNALDSSLWEIASFGASQVANGQLDAAEARGEAHYLGSVTSLVRILAEPFTRERYNLDDFLDITYGTLFETEVKKTLQSHDPRKKRPHAPAISYSLPGGFGAAGATDSGSFNRVDIFPSSSGRARAAASQAQAEAEEEAALAQERQERKRKLGKNADNANDDDHGDSTDEEEDEEEREAREAIEALRRAERAKKRRIDETGSHDLCAQLFSFA
ncbi:CBF-domain-containing protein [Testicularia cyperi]|uniref:CBF-domain-containing protein n=1 Tax=Testicularia cyperi TaxID=1882483 RepID=A0A317XT75_9BASI|nr:CBF-domain-containing protein [Testicularia cyperi]